VPSTEPIRIARIITRLNVGGPAIQAVSLSEQLESAGYHTLLVHGTVGPDEGDMSYLIPPERRFEVEHVATLRRQITPGDDATALSTLVRRLRRFRPQIVHTHMAKAGSIGRFAALIANATSPRSKRARIVHTYHGHVLEGYFSPLMTSIFIGLERVLAGVSDAIVAISPAIEQQLRDQFRIGRAGQYRVVPLGFDLSAFAAVTDADRVKARQDLNLPADADVVCTVGRLTAIKQHRLFLETVARVAESRPKVIALIAGDGELRAELEQYARDLGITDRVRFLSWRRDLATIYGASDVFLLTSRNEGTPVALIEAMASGIPGVSTDVGGVKDVIVSEEVGARVADHSAAALAAPIVRYLTDPDWRRQSGARARAAVVDRYSLDRLVGDIRIRYRDLLAAP